MQTVDSQRIDINLPVYVSRPTAIMSFPDALKNVLINKFGDFNGRASRSEYWWWVLGSFIIQIPTTFLDSMIFGWGYDDPTWFTWLVTLVLLIPTTAVTVRRLHDTGKSGWFLLIMFIPLVNICFFIVLLVWFIQDGNSYVNSFGDVPTNVLPDDQNA